MNSVISNNIKLKYSIFRSSDCKDIGIKNLSLLQKLICFYSLSGCLFVDMFVSNKRQNGRIDRSQILCGTSRDLMEGL